MAAYGQSSHLLRMSAMEGDAFSMSANTQDVAPLVEDEKIQENGTYGPTKPNLRRSPASRCEGGMSWADIQDEEGDEFFNIPPDRVPQPDVLDTRPLGPNNGQNASRRDPQGYSGRRFYQSNSQSNMGRGFSNGNESTSQRRGTFDKRGQYSFSDDRARKSDKPSKQSGTRGRFTRDSPTTSQKDTRFSKDLSEKRTAKTKKKITISGTDWLEVPVQSGKRDSGREDTPEDMWESSNEKEDNNKNDVEAAFSDSDSDSDTTSESCKSYDSDDQDSSENSNDIDSDTEASPMKKVWPLTKKELREAKKQELNDLMAVLSEFNVGTSERKEEKDDAPSCKKDAQPAEVENPRSEVSQPSRKKNKEKKPKEKETEVNHEKIDTLPLAEAALKAKLRATQKKPSNANSTNDSIIAAAIEAKKKKEAAANAAKKKQKKALKYARPK